MDKKNTMLLTVIAVATLLVAVVGATFAYFSVTGKNSTTTVTGTVQADSVGTVAIASGDTSFGIYVTAADMAESIAPKAYYSTTDTITVGTSAYNSSSTTHTIATATVTGGETNTKYTCTFTLTPTVDGTMATNLVAGDAQLVLAGMGLSETYDLTTIQASYTGTVELTGADATSSLTGYLVFNNTGSNQNSLAGGSLTVSLAITNWKCDTAA